MFEITYRKQAVKYLQKMPAHKATRFTQAFKRIARCDEAGLDIMTFQGVANAYRLKLGSYRAIYTKVDERLLIEVVKIGSRGDIYK